MCKDNGVSRRKSKTSRREMSEIKTNKLANQLFQRLKD